MSILPFLNCIESLKKTKRRGWENEEIECPESIADHMYRMSIITLLCTDTSLDKDRMMKIVLVHDMAEAIVGDITPLDKVPKHLKQERELAAMQNITQVLLPTTYASTSEDFMTLFLEYEHRASPEARFVKDVDKFELVVQTFEYERAGKVRRLDHFIESEKMIEHPLVRGWCDDVLQQRQAWWTSQAQMTNGEAVAATTAATTATKVVNGA